jgi:hypothetical protein
VTLAKEILGVAGGLGLGVVMIFRGIVLCFFLVPSLLVWLVALLLWPLLRLCGVRPSVNPLFYSRWATQLLDAVLTRLLPLPNGPWPWKEDRRYVGSWRDTMTLPWDH